MEGELREQCEKKKQERILCVYRWRRDGEEENRSKKEEETGKASNVEEVLLVQRR